jgi:hypothetical protein
LIAGATIDTVLGKLWPGNVKKKAGPGVKNV